MGENLNSLTLSDRQTKRMWTVMDKGKKYIVQSFGGVFVLLSRLKEKERIPILTKRMQTLDGIEFVLLENESIQNCLLNPQQINGIAIPSDQMNRILEENLLSPFPLIKPID